MPGLSLLLILALSLCLNAPEEPPKARASPVPESLGGLPLFSHTSGEAALRELSMMHGESEKLILTDGHIATYGSSGEVVLWIGETEGKETAQRLLEYMNERMGASGSFSKPLLRIISDRGVYFVTGMGASNYYFASDRDVVWIGVKSPGPGSGDAVVLEFLQ